MNDSLFAQYNIALKRSSPLTAAASTHAEATASRPIAVIDIGTSSIRMAVAELIPIPRDEGAAEDSGIISKGPPMDFRMLEILSQGVSLGKDTFTRGELSRDTIEACVRVLQKYRKKLDEYAITRPDQVRVVATSAVREAANRLAFIDRVYIATGFVVEPIDEAEVHRITYRSVQPLLKARKDLAHASSLITEVGGGSTEILLIQDGNVAFSHSFRLGSLRLTQSLKGLKSTLSRRRSFMEQEIQRTLESVPERIPVGKGVHLVALGGDMRFAVRMLLGSPDRDQLNELKMSELSELIEDVVSRSEETLVQKYHISFPEAETLGPALLIYKELANVLQVGSVLVSHANLRDGLLKEMVDRDIWTDDFRQQIVNSAIELGRKYHFDEEHAVHVAKLSSQLFDGTRSEHRLDSRHRLLLYVSALLHEIGGFVSNTSMHKHSMYLITNSELFGLSQEDELLVGLIARYHRRASPKPTHQGYNMLSREGRVTVSKLAALLRLAIALNTARDQRVTKVACQREGHKLVLHADNLDDVTIEQMSLRQASGLFEEVFGLKVELKGVQSTELRPSRTRL